MDNFNNLENLYSIDTYNKCPETTFTGRTIFGEYDIKRTWCITYDLDTKHVGCYNGHSGFVTGYIRIPGWKRSAISEKLLDRTLVRCLTVNESTIFIDFYTFAIAIFVLYHIVTTIFKLVIRRF